MILNRTIIPLLSFLLIAALSTFLDIPRAGAQQNTKSDYLFNEEKPQVDYNKVLAKVNGYNITLGELRARLLALPIQIQEKYQSYSGRRELLDQLIKEVILEQAAKKAGLNDNPITSGSMSIASREVLIRAITQKDILTVPVSEEAAKRWYSEHLAELVQPESVHVRHILLKSESDAKKVLSKLRKKNSNFAKIASDESLDPNTRVLGGDLGYIYRGQTVSEFELAAFNTPIGQLSDVVQSPFGYHIIKVEDKRSAGPIPFNQVFDQIKDRIKYDLFIKPLLDKADIAIFDDTPESGAGAVPPSK